MEVKEVVNNKISMRNSSERVDTSQKGIMDLSPMLEINSLFQLFERFKQSFLDFNVLYINRCGLALTQKIFMELR